MKLLTKEVLKKLPALYETDGQGDAVKVPLKLFNAFGAGTWYIVEYDPDQELAFGYVTGLGCDELGYISLVELRTLRGLERDRCWNSNTTLAQVKCGERS